MCLLPAVPFQNIVLLIHAHNNKWITEQGIDWRMILYEMYTHFQLIANKKNYFYFGCEWSEEFESVAARTCVRTYAAHKINRSSN